MEFPKSQLVEEAALKYYKSNVDKYVRAKKEIIYLPKDCSDQMADLVKSHVDLRVYRSTLKSNRAGAKYYKIQYTKPGEIKNK